MEEAEKAGVIRRIPGIVVDPLPGTVSERVGMQKGDIVRAINGDIVEDIRDVFDILSVKGSHVFTLQR